MTLSSSARRPWTATRSRRVLSRGDFVAVRCQELGQGGEQLVASLCGVLPVVSDLSAVARILTPIDLPGVSGPPQFVPRTSDHREQQRNEHESERWAQARGFWGARDYLARRVVAERRAQARGFGGARDYRATHPEIYRRSSVNLGCPVIVPAPTRGTVGPRASG
jgi:hypothetical protein